MVEGVYRPQGQMNPGPGRTIISKKALVKYPNIGSPACSLNLDRRGHFAILCCLMV